MSVFSPGQIVVDDHLYVSDRTNDYIAIFGTKYFDVGGTMFLIGFRDIKMIQIILHIVVRDCK